MNIRGLYINRLPQVNVMSLLLMTLIAALTCAFLGEYLSGSLVSVIICIACIPFLLQKQEGNIVRVPVVVMILFFVVMGLLMPVKTLLYFSLVCCLVAVLEWSFGKQHWLLFLSFAFASPVFDYLANTFTFPIRIWLSETVGDILQLINPATRTTGTSVWFGDTVFAIEPGCMGLNMFSLSFQVSVLLIARAYSGKLNSLRLPRMLFFFMNVFLFIITSNLARILLLVLFKWLPGTWEHEAAGLLCFVLYVMLPANWLARRMRRSKVAEPGTGSDPIRSFRAVPALLLLITSISMQIIYLRVNGNSSYGKIHLPVIAGYKLSAPAQGVVKLDAAGYFIYVKKVRGFFDTDHQPMMCWKGSGYVFSQVKENAKDDLLFYSAILEKGNDRLYTAWWYDNGKKQTISAWQWRWGMICGENDYALVNITSYSEERLLEAIRQVKAGNTIPAITDTEIKIEKHEKALAKFPSCLPRFAVAG